MLELRNIELTTKEGRLCPPLSLKIEKGSIATIMGPSGCGKSTLLSAISGSISGNFTVKGEIYLRGRRIDGLPIEERRVGMLFQDDLLFPHMNVEENLLFALPASLSKDEKKQAIHQALQRARLAGFEKRDIETLSGGQRARISLVRTLLAKPWAVLLDEPFSKLDTPLRISFRQFVEEQIIEMNIPALLVTHDIEDAIGADPIRLVGERND